MQPCHLSNKILHIRSCKMHRSYLLIIIVFINHNTTAKIVLIVIKRSDIFILIILSTRIVSHLQICFLLIAKLIIKVHKITSFNSDSLYTSNTHAISFHDVFNIATGKESMVANHIKPCTRNTIKTL